MATGSKPPTDGLTQVQAAEVMVSADNQSNALLHLRETRQTFTNMVKSGKMKAGAARKTVAERKGPVEVRHRLADEERTWRKSAEPEVKAELRHAVVKRLAEECRLR